MRGTRCQRLRTSGGQQRLWRFRYLCRTDQPRHPERCSNTSQRSQHAAARFRAARHGWQRLVWHVWDALPASKDQRGTATAPAVPISVPDRPATPSRLINSAHQQWLRIQTAAEGLCAFTLFVRFRPGRRPHTKWRCVCQRVSVNDR